VVAQVNLQFFYKFFCKISQILHLKKIQIVSQKNLSINEKRLPQIFSVGCDKHSILEAPK
jgi:hypothetical protein